MSLLLAFGHFTYRYLLNYIAHFIFPFSPSTQTPKHMYTYLFSIIVRTLTDAPLCFTLSLIVLLTLFLTRCFIFALQHYFYQICSPNSR